MFDDKTIRREKHPMRESIRHSSNVQALLSRRPRGAYHGSVPTDK